MNKKSWLKLLDFVANGFEITIAMLLLAVIAVKLFDGAMYIIGQDIIILNVDFERVLSIAFSLVIGVEFVRMLCKHAPDTVIDILLFASARHIILYNEGMVEMIIGIAVIAGLFAIKKFLIMKRPHTDDEGA